VTLDQLIAALQHVRATSETPPVRVGAAHVAVECSVANTPCWVHPEDLYVDVDPSGVTVIRVKGQIGA
jgi:hypothetical protein